ncbi:MAG: hypothetical protein ABUT39_21765 [Acidobacteriota bacterium]
MPQTRRRVVSILCLVAFLALPLMAQPTRESDLSVLRLISAVWERLTAPASEAYTSSAWEADGSDPLPTPTPTPAPGETGRGGWDPNG